VATVVVAKWCKQLDQDVLDRELAAGPSNDGLVADAKAH
jgi:hypothetical protein